MRQLPAAILLPAMLAATTLGAQEAARPLCAGVSFDRGCRAMLQYEIGYRSPVVGHGPRLRPTVEFDDNEFEGQLFIGGGLMFRRSPADAVGVVADVGTSGAFGTFSLGARWAHHLRANSRLDLTAGLLAKPMHRVDVDAGETKFTSVGAFGEATFHGTDYFSVGLRPEFHLPSSRSSPGAAVLAGGRFEGVTGLAATVLLAVLYGAAVAAWGNGGT